MAKFSQQGFADAVQLQLEEEAQRIGEEEISKALEQIESKLRERLGILVMRIAQNYDFAMREDRVVISVKNEVSTDQVTPHR